MHRPRYYLKCRICHYENRREYHNCSERFQPKLIKRGPTTPKEESARQATVSRGNGECTLREEGDHHKAEDSTDHVRRKQRYGIGEPFAPGQPLLRRQIQRSCNYAKDDRAPWAHKTGQRSYNDQPHQDAVARIKQVWILLCRHVSEEHY